MLKVENVTYGYNSAHKVLDHFSLTFTEPGVYGLLGKNGTGKSTLLYLIMGLLRPQKGRVSFGGVDTKDRNPEALCDMFIVPEEYNLPDVKLKDYISVLSPLYPRFNSTLLSDLLQRFDMKENVRLGSLSMGQKKKVYICIALAAGTRLLLMDEPTNGLDILAKAQFRDIISHGKRPDQIIVISTHQVKDVETMLNHVTIVNNNKVLLCQALDSNEPVNLEELFISAVTREEVGA